MQPTHARTLARARSHLAALADGAPTIEASSAYEHALIDLDRLHHDNCPAIDPQPLAKDRATLLPVVVSALERLKQHGADDLRVELILATLHEAAALESS